MQVLANRIEFCWIHLRGIGSLENSLWGYDGQAMRVWLNALSMATIDSNSDASAMSGPLEDVKESVNIPLDFYPLCECAFMRGIVRALIRCSGAHEQGDNHRLRARDCG
jgi:hypothetical protein